MWLIVRSMIDNNKFLRVDGLSKLTKVEELREKLEDYFDAPSDRQMLIFRGKQLVNGHTLFDYDLGLNDTIQLVVRKSAAPIKPTEKETTPLKSKENHIAQQASTPTASVSNNNCDDGELLEGTTYKLGDIIDARDECGAWYEAELTNITKNPESPLWNTSLKVSEQVDKENKDSNIRPETKKEEQKDHTLPNKFIEDDGFCYHVHFEGFEGEDPVKMFAKDVRPRARNKIKLEDIEIGQRIMVNYNPDDPTERGYWYDAVATSKRCTRTIKELDATVFIGKELVAMDTCRINFWWELFAIETPGSQLNKITDPEENSLVKRTNKPRCDFCKDNPKRKCKECSCRKCGGKDQSDKQIMCDECDDAYHLWCLSPPLEQLPEQDEWFCPECKNNADEIVQGGESLKHSKKKSKMASALSTSKRDWGKGMACVGRTKMCTIVPPNHMGPIPGIEVGTQWKFRVQVSEAGVHRPHVAGIHGRDSEGAYSIVLSGGYEDDEDKGDKFTYTGSGGRDLSGNKRTAEQSCDQTLTRTNRALAKNSNCPIDAKNGGEAKNWQGGKPVRVIRNCKGRKHSNFAPEEGNRYDGIYKVVKYWPDKGKSGFIVWRYMLRRDDTTPAPWTKEGKKRMEQLGLDMQYPDGYLESQAEKEKVKQEKTPKRGRKRKVIESSDEENQDQESTSPVSSPAKKKAVLYKVSDDVKKLIKEDKENEKVWHEVLDFTAHGAQKFFAKVEEVFGCICCQDIVFKPVTTPCNHNVCKACIQRSFKAEVKTCPACRADLGSDFAMAENKTLRKALVKLYPGYENGR